MKLLQKRLLVGHHFLGQFDLHRPLLGPRHQQFFRGAEVIALLRRHVLQGRQRAVDHLQLMREAFHLLGHGAGMDGGDRAAQILAQRLESFP